VSPVTIDAGGAVVTGGEVATQRVRLSRAAVDRLADVAGVESPVDQLLAREQMSSGAGRLGGAPAVPPVGASSEGEVDDVLERAGLLAAGAPTAAARAVLTTWHAPSLAVDLEVLVDLARGRARVRSHHRRLGDRVVCLSTAGGAALELAWSPVARWGAELGRAARVDLATLRPARGSGSGSWPEAEAAPDVVETPWDLLLASGEAVRAGRPDLLDRMVADHPATTLAGRRPDLLDDAGVDDVRRWHEQLESTSRGRLHAAVLGRGSRGAVVGVVEWVLLPDGWRSLTPFTRDGWAMVRLQRVRPRDLPRALAPLAAGVVA
jgi:hypothetical protein